jgi:light-regulated signal transduction histidine kinase (bacteriophytochrome)
MNPSDSAGALTDGAQSQTDASALGEDLAALNAQLERSNKELEAFCYSLSHDLRAPFRQILSFAEMLQKRSGESLDLVSQRYLRTICDAARQAGILIEGLLAFSLMGRITMQLEVVNLNEMVEAVRRELMEAEPAERIVNWQIRALPAVRADPILIRQVLRNLLSNALKYTRKNPEARIEIGEMSGMKEHVFYVLDNGVGFDMAGVGKLFGVFQRLHSTVEFEGTGIGLANVRRMIERHGGRVWAKGAPNAGATFFFTLPPEPLIQSAQEQQSAQAR